MTTVNIGKYAITKVVELERPFAPAREFFPDLTAEMLEICQRELPAGQLTPDGYVNMSYHTFAVRTDGAAWRVRTGPGLFAVEDRDGQHGPGDGAGDGPADVTVSGPPAAVLRWVWNREQAGEPSGVAVEGAPAAVEELRRCIVVATQ